LDSAKLSYPGSYSGISKDRYPRHVGRNLFEKFEPFRTLPYSNKTKPVALPPGRAKLSTKPAPTGSTACANTIGTVWVTACSAATVWLAVARITSGVSAKFSREFTIKRSFASRPADFNPHVLTFGPTQFLQSLPDRRYASQSLRIIRSCTHEHTDSRNLPALLRPGGNRPYDRRAAEKCDELAPSHSPPRD
jgi:hypothetical protein